MTPILRECPKNILFCLNKINKELCQVKISRQINNTYSHICNVISSLKQLGLVNTKKLNRKIMVSLTPKGREVAYLLYKIDRFVK